MIVVDNGSTRRHRRGRRARSAPRSSREPLPGYGAAVHAGLLAATADYVAVMDGDGSFDPDDLLPLLDDVRSRPGRHGRRPPASGRPRACGRGTPAPATPLVAGWLRRRIGLPVPRHRADAGVPPRGPARPRPAGPPVRLPRRAAAEGDARPAGGSASTTSPTTRAPRAPARRCPARSAAPCAPPATSPGCCRERRRVAGRRQGARSPGQVKTRLGAEVGTTRAADLAAAACSTPSRPAPRRSAPSAATSRWPATSRAAVHGAAELGAALAGWTRARRSAGDGFAERLAHAHADVARRPARPSCRSAWTPRTSPAAELTAVAELRRAGHDAVLGPAARRRLVGPRGRRPGAGPAAGRRADVDRPDVRRHAGRPASWPGCDRRDHGRAARRRRRPPTPTLVAAAAPAPGSRALCAASATGCSHDRPEERDPAFAVPFFAAALRGEPCTVHGLDRAAAPAADDPWADRADAGGRGAARHAAPAPTSTSAAARAG